MGTHDLKLAQLPEDDLEALGAMARPLAHDLANLLTSLIGFTEMAHARTSDPQTQRYLERTLEGGRRAEEMIHRLLTASAPAGPDAEDVLLREPVAAALAELRRRLAGVVEIRADLSDEPLRMRGQPGRLQQMIEDLCAVHAELMPPGSRIGVTLGPAPREVRPGHAGAAHARLRVAGETLVPAEQWVLTLLEALASPSSAAGRRRGMLLRLTQTALVARAHRAALAFSWQEGTGLVLTLDLPLSPA
jgi:signal transduction histidine kinase